MGSKTVRSATAPSSSTPRSFNVGWTTLRGSDVIVNEVAIVRGAPNEEDAKRFYEFVNTPESLTLAAKKYYRIPVRKDLDRTQLPAWMNEPVNEMQIDWNVMRNQINEWLRHWDTEIRGKGN